MDDRKARTLRGRGLRLSLLAAAVLLAILLFMPTWSHAIILIPFHGTITGVVNDTSGTPVPNVSVVAYEDDGPFALLRATNSALTGPSGVYTVPALATGKYRLVFSDISGQHAQQAYPNAVDLADASDISVTDNATTTVNATLAPAAFINGNVSSAATGGPIMFASANAWRYDSYAGQWFLYGQWQGTDPSGNFRISGLAPGRYRIRLGTPADFHWASHFIGTNVDWPLFGADVTATAGTTTSVGAQTMATLDDDAFEPDDSATQARTLLLGHMYDATVYRHADETGDVDFYAFNLVRGQTYEFTSYTMAYTALDLLDTDGKTVLAVGPVDLQIDDILSEGNAHITFMAPKTGKFFLRVRSGSPYEEGAYSFKAVKILPPPVKVMGTFSVSSSSLKLGRTVRMFGKFSPTSASARRFASLQRLIATKWTKIASIRLSSTGTFSFLWLQSKRGTYTYRMMLPARTGFTSATTRTRKVRWF